MIRLLALLAAATAAAAPASAAGPEPVPASDFRLVIKDVTILDGAGATLEHHHCEWTEPQVDDRPCLAFSGDPKTAYRAIQEAGGSSATLATKVPDLRIDTVTRITERADATWLFRTRGVIDGRPHDAGWVCSADGRTCSAWKATARRGSKRAIRAAAARVKRRANV